jgi:Tfp pilus assembly protein PilN
MRPVNLLPQSARPYVASGKAGNGSYIVIGALVVLVLAVAGYVLTNNKITTHKNDLAQAQQETQAAQSKSQGLEKYAQFNAVAQTRVQSVGSLAVNRIDYERLLQETARVLPAGVWINSLDAEAVGGSAGASSGSTTPAASAPTVHLNGCAPSQKAVATTLVRLRAIHGSDEVQLNDSGKTLDLTPKVKGSGSDSGASSASGSSGCGSNFGFDILVNLTNQVTGFGDLGKKVPKSLGGGS